VRTEVREDILGGLIVKVGSRMFDSSLKSKLEGLRKTMKEA
jgi:F-type H+-transporting ATPase subunit delta